MNAHENMTYESFVRQAFSHSLHREIGRDGDPAGLAEAGLIDNTRHMPTVKAATIYSMEIFSNEIVNSGREISDVESDRLDAFSHRIFAAQTYRDILAIIVEFEETVVNTYYIREHGSLNLRP